VTAAVRARQRGIAMPELLVAVFVGVVVMAAVVQFFSMQLRATRVETARVTAQVTARATLQLLARHLEHIGRDPQHTLFWNVDDHTLAPAIVAASGDSLHYRTNLSASPSDTDTADGWENVTFSWSDGTIWATPAAGTPAPVTSGEKTRSYVPPGGLSFEYWDGGGQTLTNLSTAAARASVRRIRVTVTVIGGPEGAPSSNAPRATVSQDVYLRNLS
jgi:Tfp pilus assembly protein PilW